MSLELQLIGVHLTPGTSMPAVSRGAPFHWKSVKYSAFNMTTATLDNETSLHLFVTNAPTWKHHFYTVSVFQVETENMPLLLYPMHNWVPYLVFTVIYALTTYSSKSEIDKTLLIILLYCTKYQR